MWFVWVGCVGVRGARVEVVGVARGRIRKVCVDGEMMCGGDFRVVDNVCIGIVVV